MKNMAHGNRLWRALAAFLLAFMATAAVGQALGWKQLPAKAWDIGVGANGAVWIIGFDGPGPDRKSVV